MRRGAKPFDIPLEDVAEADAAPRGFNLNDKSRTSDVMTAADQAASVLSRRLMGNEQRPDNFSGAEGIRTLTFCMWHCAMRLSVCAGHAMIQTQ